MCAPLVWYVPKPRHQSKTSSVNKRIRTVQCDSNCLRVQRLSWYVHLFCRSPRLNYVPLSNKLTAQMSDSGDSEGSSSSTASNPQEEDSSPDLLEYPPLEDTTTSSSSSPDSITILVGGDPIDSSIFEKLSPDARAGEEKRVTPVGRKFENAQFPTICWWLRWPMWPTSPSPPSASAALASRPGGAASMLVRPLLSARNLLHREDLHVTKIWPQQLILNSDWYHVLILDPDFWSLVLIHDPTPSWLARPLFYRNNTISND